MKKIIQVLLTIVVISLLAACGGKTEGEALSEDKLVVGVTSGPHEETFEFVKELAAEEGLELELKVFTDYIMPNTALAEGDVDLNSYQHEPFLLKFNEDHGTELAAYTQTTLSAIGVYSEKISSLDDLSKGAKIGIANDPTNGARALIMFEDAGLITLDTEDKENATVLDIAENELELEFIELEAAQIPKQLSEIELGVINGNFAIENGLSPKEDSLLSESKDTPFVNILAVREENLNDPVLDKLKEIYQSKEVAEFILDQFDGVIVPSWDY